MGCLTNRITKGYDFSNTRIIVEEKDMVISAQLVGELTPGEKDGRFHVTIRRAPYTLIIDVVSETGYYRSARLSHTRVVDGHDNRINLPLSPGPSESEFTETLVGYHAQILYDNLDLPHDKLWLNAEIEIFTKSNSIIRQPVRFQFHPAYTEKKSNDAWPLNKSK